jgi:hypothetical protein
VYGEFLEFSDFFVFIFLCFLHSTFNSVTNWSSPSKGGFIDTGYVGYVQVGPKNIDRLIVETQLSNCAGSTPLYCVEAYILCHRAVEDVTCSTDEESNNITAHVVKSDAAEFESMSTTRILDDLLEGFNNANITIDSSAADQDNIDTSTQQAVTSFVANGKIVMKFAAV